MSVDAIVVGAGPNGLTAAARIARAGFRVAVYERAPTIGGSTRTTSLMTPDVVHDVGATVVPFAAASPAFAALGLDLPMVFSGLALAHPLAGDRAAIVDRSLDVTADALGADAARYRRLIGPFVRHFDAFADSTLAPAIRQARHPVLAARLGPLLVLPGTTLAHLFSTDEARALLIGLSSHATVPVSRPLTAGVGLTLLAAAHAVGWPMIRGGTQVLTEQLAALVRAEGGEIVVDREVTSLTGLPPARVTLLDVTPRQFADIVPGAARAYRRWKYGPGVCKVDYVLSGPVPWTAEACRRAATVHLGGTAPEMLESEREVAGGRVHERPYTIVVQPQLADPTRGPRAGNPPLGLLPRAQRLRTRRESEHRDATRPLRTGMARPRHREARRHRGRKRNDQPESRRRRHLRWPDDGTADAVGRASRSLAVCNECARRLPVFELDSARRRCTRNERLVRGRIGPAHVAALTARGRKPVAAVVAPPATLSHHGLDDPTGNS